MADIQVKNAKAITLGGKGVKKITDINGNVLWQKSVAPTEFCNVLLSDVAISGKDFYLPLDNAIQ